MLVLKDISKRYGNKEILTDINISIPKGKMISLLGKNGMGKSTLIKIMTGILFQDKGSSEIDGYNIIDNPIEYKSKFGYVPDDYNIFLNLTGLEYLNFICDIYNIEADFARREIDELSRYLEIEKYLNQKISSYSKGTKQKIMFISAIIHNPEILILDEPFNGLDPVSVHNVKKLLKEFVNKGKTVIFSTHILEIAENLSDIVLILHDKKIVANIKIVDLLKGKENKLEKIFLDLTKEE